MQEWCAPRILIDGTEAYSALPERSWIEGKSIFLNPDFVHLLRNPRECLGEANVSCDIAELENQWLKFTKYMLQLERANVQKFRHEDPESSVCAFCSRLSIPVPSLSGDETQRVTQCVYEGPLQSDTRAVAWRLGYQLSDRARKFQFIVGEAKQGAVTWL